MRGSGQPSAALTVTTSCRPYGCPFGSKVEAIYNHTSKASFFISNLYLATGDTNLNSSRRSFRLIIKFFFPDCAAN